MLTDQQMNLLRKIAIRLRELKPYLERINLELEQQRMLLPERQWRTGIDDEMIASGVALDFAEQSLADTIEHIGEITGEDLLPASVGLPHVPFKMETDAEADETRRRLAADIRERRRA